MLKTTIQKKNGTFFCWAAAMLTASFIMIGCQQPAGGNTGSGGSEKLLIKYDSSKISVEAKIADSNWKPITSGSEVSAGTRLWFDAKDIPQGKQVDKWKVNTKEVFRVYNVNAADAVAEGLNKVITVTYTLKESALVVIRFDNSKIKVYKRNSSSGSPILNGDTVYEGTEILFDAKDIPQGKQVDKWLINSKKEVKVNYIYRVNVADAVAESSNKVITVTYRLK